MNFEWDEAKLLVQDIENIMSRKIIYTDAPPEIEEAFARSVRVKDFLPPPEKLVLKTSKEQVAVSLDSGNVAFYDDDARYTDAPPDVREAIDYAIEHNLFLTREQFLDLLENSKQETQKPQPKKRYASAQQKAAVMA
jgi:hypothetical protein